MPPEAFPWDRKELRKHEVGGGMGGYGGPRWREPSFHHHRGGGGGGGGGGPPRWLPDFRYRPPGYGKQGGRHIYHDEFGHGSTSSRSNDERLDGESCRPSGSGRYGKSSRENRESFGQRDSKVHSVGFGPQPSGPGRPNNLCEQRSVDVKPSYSSSRPISSLTNSFDLSQPKDQHDINNGVGTVGSIGQKSEGEKALDSIDWKPIKWTRSGSLNARGSSFNHSISSKGMAPDSSEMSLELTPKDSAPVQSPSGDAAPSEACLASVGPLEETNSRKKPRLGFGEGLAKYEKKKVVGVKNSTNNAANACTSNSQPGHSYSSSLTEKSPRLVELSECASPATPSSVACSSSPGLEEKQLVDIGSFNNDNACKHKSPCLQPDGLSDQSEFNLENVPVTLISHLSSSISEVLQSDDPSSLGPSFMRSSAMNKLLVLKNDISKTLEATESEIDMLENELKSLIAVPEGSYHCSDASIDVLDQCYSKPCENQSAVSNVISRPTTLQLVMGSSDSPKDDHMVLKDVDVDSPGSATSKFVETSSSDKDVCPQLLKDVEVLEGSDVNKSIMETESSMRYLIDKTSSGSSSADDSASSDDDNFQSRRCDSPYELLSSNRECAHRLSEEFNKLLPSSDYHFDFSRIVSASCVENDNVRKRFWRKKNDIQLKEKILTLKFKMFWHLREEDTHLLSLKRLRTKSQKKYELSLQRGNGGHLKLRTSTRSQCSLRGGGLVPSTELINFASRLLADVQVKPHRSVLKMPSMILDRQDRNRSIFISHNNQVEDPRADEKGRILFKLWSPAEKEIFIDRLAIVGKNFEKIATVLDNKTTADCVEFYYKNHKEDDFERAKKKSKLAKQAKSCSASTYLRTSGKERNFEANSACVDRLGAATAIATNVDERVAIKQKPTLNPYVMSNSIKRARGDGDIFFEGFRTLDVCNSEREAVAANVLAGICASLSSEAMSSCITSSVDPAEGYQERKYQRFTRQPLTPEVTQIVDEETCSDESCVEINSSDWTDEEKALLIEAVSSYGKDFTMISRHVRTRSPDQCKVFYSKTRKCLELDLIFHGPGNLITGDVNGGASDVEDGCIVETGSVVCSEKSELKMQENNVSTDVKLGFDSTEVEVITLKPDLNRGLVDSEVGDVGSTDPELTTKGLSSGCHNMVDNSEISINGDAGNRNSADFSSDIVVGHGFMRPNDHNLQEVQDSETQNGVLYGKELKAKPYAERSVLLEQDSVGHTFLDNTNYEPQDGNDSIQQTPELALYASQEACVDALQAGSVLLDLSSDQSVLNSQKNDYEPRVRSSKTDGQHLSRGTVEKSSCIPKRNPTSALSMEEISSVVGLKNHVPDVIHAGHYMGRESYLQRCNISRPAGAGPKALHGSHERDCSRPSSGTTVDMDRPPTTRDVKLFGQILSKPSQQKSDSRVHRREGTNSHRLHSVERSSNLACDGHLTLSKNDCNGSGDTARNFGTWDRSKMHNGFSSFPNSASLLSEYPTAFSSSAPSFKVQQQAPALGVVQNGECSLNGVSVFPSRVGSSSNGLSDLNMNRNQELQPFSIGMRQQLQQDNIFPEMQRGGCDVVAGMQQLHSRGLVGINLGRRGVLVGGHCAGISDPVAAIRRHYTKSEQFSGHAGSIIREDDPWSGKGSAGR